MPPKRKAASNWESEIRDAIDNGEPAAVRAIEKSLVKLQRRAQARLISLQQETGTGVCMVDSNQTQDQDCSYNMCSRSVEASFTAGPKAMPFSISFENEDVEGDETIRIECELFIYEDGVCGKVADDENGHFYMQDMHAAGVDTPSAKLEPGVTGKCLILITADAERSMNTFLGISAELSIREIDPHAIADSQYLYIESYLVTSESGRAAAVEARQMAQKNGTKVALSFSDPGIIANFSDGVKEIMGDKVDLVFCNQEEAFSFAQVSDLPAAVEKIKLVADQFVITLGAKGALIYDGQELIAIDGVEVEAIDTNGAGDMFAGAFLYCLSQGINHQRGGEFASAAAARVVTQYGPRLSANEYRSLVKTFFD